MKLQSNIYFHVFISFIFAVGFCIGVHYVYTYISQVNYEKTVFPVLVYTDTLAEANEVLSFARTNPNYLSFHLSEPHELTALIVEKYNLSDYNTIIGELTLPFLLEINVKPNSSESLVHFVIELKRIFPEYIIQFNENIWKNIDVRVDRLFIIAYIIQGLVLFTYISIQLLFRMLYLSKNKEMVFAIQNSGLSPRKIRRIKFIENLVFLSLSSILILITNFFTNYFLVYKELYFNLDYLNIDTISILFVANLLFALFRK